MMNKATLSIIAGLAAIRLASYRGSPNKFMETQIAKLGRDLEVKYDLIPKINGGHVHIYMTAGGFLKLSSIRIPKDQRGKGIGSKIMNELTSFADRNGLEMALTPAGGLDNDPFGPKRKKRLIQWYKSFGFKPNKGRNKDFRTRETMIRLPQSSSSLGSSNSVFSSSKLIIVDVQPAYTHSIRFDVGELIEWANSNFSEVLVLWNGPDLGYVNEGQLKNFYFEKLGEYLGDYEKADPILSDFLSKAEFFDKGYGFFRDLMPSSTTCLPREDTVKLVTYMLKNGISDIRQLSRTDLVKIGITGLQYNELEQYSFHIPSLSEILPQWNDSVIVGGAEDECMDEVTILGEAQGIAFHKEGRYIY